MRTACLLLLYIGLTGVVIAAGSGEGTMKHAYTNHLINEKSPYLLQHAHNPVNWYPWGDEAFERARKEDKPIFLSIGYATCHWCHVMERESFEDPEVAALMNEVFISVKVDREERPDIDGIYMTVCQMLTGSGGWPLTVILTPDREPFFAGTYFPKSSRYGRPGMMDMVPHIQKLWTEKRSDVTSSAEEIISALHRSAQVPAGSALSPAVLDKGFSTLSSQFDAVNGGFGTAPKFPTPHQLLFLLRVWHRTGDGKALLMVEETLQAMIRGGIFDQVGLGFHRYSTDPEWRVPHFEKMLYDQAMIAMALTETYQATGKAIYRTVATDIYRYVLRDMRDSGGGFYSAEDADSEGVEGKFYTWTLTEIRNLLPEDDAEYVITRFNMSESGNFHEAGPGKNILYLEKNRAVTAGDEERWERIRKTLYTARDKRIRPLLDDKILTDWNGLMIAALAKSARAFDAPEYAQAAEQAAGFILNTMVREDGTLLHRYRTGDAGIAGLLDDYAFLTWGLIELYQTTLNPDTLAHAMSFNQKMTDLFQDSVNGGFFTSPSHGEALIVRQKEAYDGAIPSGNSVAMLNLVRLSRITGDTALEVAAVTVGKSFSAMVSRAPTGFTQMLAAVDFLAGPAYEIVTAGVPGKADTEAMLSAIRHQYLPNAVLVLHPPGDAGTRIRELASYVAAQTEVDNRATVYLCENFACRQPVTDPIALVKLLEGLKGNRHE